MPVGIVQPLNKIKLANVSVVKYKKGGKRFEIACHKNTVLDWRNGLNKDIDSVLQIPKIFSNVSKGQVASDRDIKAAFGEECDQNKAIEEILTKGVLQVSQSERHVRDEDAFREVVTLLCNKCVNPSTGRPFSDGVMRAMLKEMGASITADRPTKVQAMDLLKHFEKEGKAIRQLWNVKVILSTKIYKANSSKIEAYFAATESCEHNGDETELEGSLEPGKLANLQKFIIDITKGSGSAEKV